MDEFEQIAADLEKSIKVDETAGPLSKEALELLKDPAAVKKALALGAAELLKAKGAQTTDLSQEKAPKDKNVTDDEDDPAEEPVKSGKGYKDTRPYVGKMGKGHDDDDDDADGDKKPSFFGKGKGKKVKKSEETEEGSDDVEDVTEFMGEMAKCMNWLVDEISDLKKGQAELTDGSAIFGEVLHQMAEDPRRDNLTISMAKALNKALTELADLKKAVSDQKDLVKAVAEMPGAPRVAGLTLMKAEADGAEAGVAAPTLSTGDKQRLYGAAVKKSITMDEYRHALKTGDVKVLEKAAKA